MKTGLTRRELLVAVGLTLATACGRAGAPADQKRQQNGGPATVTLTVSGMI